MVNATGWSELIDGRVWQAPFVMYNTTLGGWFIFGLYLLFQAMLYYKTKSSILSFVVGLIFTYSAITMAAVPVSLVRWLILILVFQGAWVVYYAFFK